MPRVSSETSNEEQQLMEQNSLIKARDKERRKSAKKAEKRKKERANEKHRLRKKRSRERDSQAKKERLQSIRIKPTSSHRRSPEPFMVKVADPVVLLLGMTSTHCPELEACQPRALNANQIMEELVALERQGHFSSEGNSSTPMLFRDEARRMLASKLSGFHCIASADKYPGGSVLHANFYLSDFNQGIDFVNGLVRRYFPDDGSKLTIQQVNLDHFWSPLSWAQSCWKKSFFFVTLVALFEILEEDERVQSGFPCGIFLPLNMFVLSQLAEAKDSEKSDLWKCYQISYLTADEAASKSVLNQATESIPEKFANSQVLGKELDTQDRGQNQPIQIYCGIKKEETSSPYFTSCVEDVFGVSTFAQLVEKFKEKKFIFLSPNKTVKKRTYKLEQRGLNNFAVVWTPPFETKRFRVDT